MIHRKLVMIQGDILDYTNPDPNPILDYTSANPILDYTGCR